MQTVERERTVTVAAREYVHALGQVLEDCSDKEQRIQLARMLGASASPDAQPYLLDAMSEELDPDVLKAFRDALNLLDASEHRTD